MQKLSEKAQENKTKYNIEYAKKKYSRIPLDVPKEYHEYLKAVAQSQGMTLNGFIKEAIEEKCNNVKEEVPPEVFTNLKAWLIDHGHSIDDYIDCLQYIGKE